MRTALHSTGDTCDIRLWIDPGESTGWAAWLTPPTDVPVLERFHAGQGPWRAVVESLESLATAYHFDNAIILGWEDYIVLPGVPRDPIALKVIGALEYVCHQLTRVQVLGRRSASHRTIGVRNLAAVGWHRPGERDTDQASTHLLSDLLENHLLPDNLLARILVTEADHGGC
jgi:hypothetical protein